MHTRVELNWIEGVS
jgi:hypothetical protein